MVDVKTESAEQSAEALALCQQLELEGQLPKKGEEVSTARFPYRLMTDEEQFVYNQLCPEKCSIKSYRNDPIPLEVLKTAVYAKSLCDSRVDYLEVWAAETSRVKDPILVGRASPYSGAIYILARWGEELLPLQVLSPDAIKIWYEKRIDSLNKIKLDVESALKQPMPLSWPKGRSEPYISL